MFLEMLTYFVRGKIRHLFEIGHPDIGHSADPEAIFHHTQTTSDMVVYKKMLYILDI